MLNEIVDADRQTDRRTDGRHHFIDRILLLNPAKNSNTMITDKLGMDIFHQLEPVFRSKVSFCSQKYVTYIRTIIFQYN